MNIPEELRQRIALDTQAGVLVESVTPGGVAYEAGLRAGDIILEADRSEIASRGALETVLLQATTARIPLVVRRESRILYLVIERPEPRP
jgi:serine protease Do